MVFDRSNGIYRSVFVALAGLALTGAQQPAKQTQTATSGQQARDTANPSTAPSETSQPAYRAYPDRYSDTCYNAQNHDTADLCAQWRAAIATEKAAAEARMATIAAIVGIVLSLSTVIGLIITIWQTHGALGEARRGNRLNLMFERRSRREARKFAEDQERALAIAERNATTAAESNEILRQSDRPWIVNDGFETGNFLNGSYNGKPIKKGFGALLKFVNVGNGAATNVIATHDFRVTGLIDAVPHFNVDPDKAEPSVIGPKQGMTTSMKVLNDEQTKLFFEQRIKLYLYGRITYSDISGLSKFLVEICCTVTFEGMRAKPGQQLEPNFSFQPIGPQNRVA